MIVIALAVFQVSTWGVNPRTVTVGDTVALERRFAVETGVHARLLPLDGNDAVEPLRAPELMTGNGTLTVRYSIAVFLPGVIPVGIPPIELQYPDGHAVTVQGDTAWVPVRSVLPQQDPLPDPQPSLGPIARQQARIWPLVLLVLTALAIITGWAVRRRWARPRPVWAVPPIGAVPVPAERWAAAGEPRAVAAVAADGLRDRIEETLPSASRHLSIEECIEIVARERPEWPVRELDEVLHALERARFAPAVSNDILELGQRANALAGTLDSGHA